MRGARVCAALAVSAALHTLVLASAPGMFAAPAPAQTHPAPIQLRLIAGHSLPSVGPQRGAARPGSELAEGPKLGAVRGPRYFRASELDEKPRPITSIEPAPPPSAARTRGRVVARVLINESGAADAVRVESSEPQALFDDAVTRAFGAARYRPGMKDGRRVKSQMMVEVNFHGEDKPAEDLPGPR